eukprot:6264861-Pyramimonas_sp.AAC.1
MGLRCFRSVHGHDRQGPPQAAGRRRFRGLRAQSKPPPCRVCVLQRAGGLSCERSGGQQWYRSANS